MDKEEQAQLLMKTLVLQGINIKKFELKKPSLNEIFIEKVGEYNARFNNSNKIHN